MSDVSHYMSRPVKSIKHDETVQEAAKNMKALNVGALVVLKEGEYVGMITDTDMTRKVAAQSADAKSILVDSMMTSPLITIEGTASLEEANRMMKEKNIRHLIVTEKGKVSGLISVRDLTAYIYNFFRMTEEIFPEKRGYIRLPLSAIVTYTDQKDRNYEGITYDIGAGGLFIQTNDPLPKGSKITMNFALPKSEKDIQSSGVIAWLRSKPEDVSVFPKTKAKAEVTYVRQKMQRNLLHSGMGVKFIDILERDRIRIMDFIMSWVEKMGSKEKGEGE